MIDAEPEGGDCMSRVRCGPTWCDFGSTRGFGEIEIELYERARGRGGGVVGQEPV